MKKNALFLLLLAVLTAFGGCGLFGDGGGWTEEDALLPYVGIWASGDSLVWWQFYDDGSWLKADLRSGEVVSGTTDVWDGWLDLYDDAGEARGTVRLTDDGELTDDAEFFYWQDMERLPFIEDDAGGAVTDPGLHSGRQDIDYQPVFAGPVTGNFTDIDKNVFRDSDYSPENIVGRWYEDGWSNGYYFDIYGDGTWRFCGEETVCGIYTISYSTINLMDAFYGVNVGQIYMYDDDGPVLSFSAFHTGEMFIRARTLDGTLRCRRASESKLCSDLEDYYAKKYPYAWLKGDWYPVGNHSRKHCFEIGGDGRWGEIINNSAIEIGTVELTGPGSFKAEGANTGAVKTFKYTGDGYLYIDGEPYEKVAGSRFEIPSETLTGRFLYYDTAKDKYSDRGYVLNSDWTFRSLPDSASAEHGVFIVVGDYVNLYDESGRYIRQLFQDVYLAEGKELYVIGENESLYCPD